MIVFGQIGEHVAEISRWNPSTATGRFTYVDVGSIDRDAKVVAEPQTIPTHTAPSRARQLLKAGDVLVSTVRPNLNAVAHVQPDLDGATASTGFCVLRATDQLDGRYLFHWVRTPRFVGEMVKLSTGASYPAVTDRIVKQSLIPLPPIEEQRRIAEALDAADALRAKRRQAIEKLDTLTQAIFIDMFGDPVQNPRGWSVVPLGEVLQSATYGTSRKAGNSGAYPVLRMGNITSRGELDLSDLKFLDLEEDELDKHLVRKGDVLFNRTNSADLVGKTAVYDREEASAYAGYLIRLRTGERLTPEYLGAHMNLPSTKTKLRHMCRSIVGMANINAQEVQRMHIPLPPIEEQRTYVTSENDVKQRRFTLIKQSRTLDSLFGSLQQRAFSG